MLDRNKMVAMAQQSGDRDLVELIHNCIRSYDRNKIAGDTDKAARSLEVGIRALAKTYYRFPGEIVKELEA